MPDNETGCDPATEQCHLCGDVAVVGRVLDIDASLRVGRVRIGAEVTSVAFDLVDARVGDDVLVHLGFAIELVGAT